MHPVHDADVMVLLAITLSSKRKPAALEQIISALELVQHPSPILSTAKLVDAFKRLSVSGLIEEREGGYTLPVEAQKVLAAVPAKAEMLERLFKLQEKLATYNPPRKESIALALTIEQLNAAVQAHRATHEVTVPTMLMPKLKQKETEERMARPRYPTPKRRPTSNKS